MTPSCCSFWMRRQHGLGEADAIGDLGGAQLAVALEQVQDSGIQLVHETMCAVPRQTRQHCCAAGAGLP